MASAWCAPITREGYQSVLKFSADEVKTEISKMSGSWPKEIHFASGLRRHGNTLFEKAIVSSLQDTTIHKNGLPWNGWPLAFRTVAYCPEVESILPGYDKRTFHKNLRARGIISLLMPLILYNGNLRIEASVILDTEIWKDAVSICEARLKGPLRTSSVELAFSCENSDRVPGLQIADLAAGIFRHYLIDGSCEKAFSLLNAGTIHRLNRPKMVN